MFKSCEKYHNSFGVFFFPSSEQKCATFLIRTLISLYQYFLADFDSSPILYTSKYWCDTLVRKCHLYKMDIYFNGSFWFASFFFYVLKMCFQLWLWNLVTIMNCLCVVCVQSISKRKRRRKNQLEQNMKHAIFCVLFIWE